MRRGNSFNWAELNLSKLEAADLDAPFAEDKILEAIMQQPNDKAPSPDGFTWTSTKAVGR